MLKSITQYIADGTSASSLSTGFRAKRHAFFLTMLDKLPRPIRLLDAGGTMAFWEMMAIRLDMGLEITLLNSSPDAGNLLKPFSHIVGDACNMSTFKDGEFDIVFSNSVIEHVGDTSRQRAMAKEVRRVGKTYFIQTPNKYFPIEPHFYYPFFQFLPLEVRAWLLKNADIRWYADKNKTFEQSWAIAADVKLLSFSEFSSLFPDAQIYREQCIGLTKSLIAYRY